MVTNYAVLNSKNHCVWFFEFQRTTKFKESTIMVNVLRTSIWLRVVLRCHFGFHVCRAEVLHDDEKNGFINKEKSYVFAHSVVHVMHVS